MLLGLALSMTSRRFVRRTIGFALLTLVAIAAITYSTAASAATGASAGANGGFPTGSSTTTSLTANPTTAYTSSPGNSVTLTATVTSSSTVNEGTVTFSDAGNSINCSGGNTVAVSNGSASCSTTFSTQGIDTLTATYNGTIDFNASTNTANIFLQKHATNIGLTYCNSGAISAAGTSESAYSATSPYPSVIDIGDGVNTAISGSVSTVSVELSGFNASSSNGLHLLLMSPDRNHSYDFLSGETAQINSGSYTFEDGNEQPSTSSALNPGTYGPGAFGTPPDSFTPGPPVPAPQLPSSFLYAPPAGSSSFESAFVGATADGQWSLYLYNSSGSAANATRGWCLNITPASGHPTTTTVTSSATPNAALGQTVTFYATVSASPTPNVGVVTFTENGNPLVGAPNGGIANVSNGVASISTSSLPEGDHTITGMFSDSSHTYNNNYGTVTLRVDKATSAPTLSSGTWNYCNTGTITIPTGTDEVNDFGAAQPNPSNITVSNMPGTIASMSLTLDGLTLASDVPVNLESLLVGPNGSSNPTTAQTFDFFSLAGGTTAFGPQNTTFADTDSPVTSGSAPGAAAGPASLGTSPDTFTASLFSTLPSTYQYAASQGAFTFNTGTDTGSSGGVYADTNPNGTWSLYFDQLIHSTGSRVGGWCLGFVENAITGTGATSNTGTGPGNEFVAGSTGSVTLSLANNGVGSTGDPDGNHPMVVAGTLPSGLTLGAVPTGSPWNCIASTTTAVSCTSDSAIASGSNYATLTLPVNVSSSAPDSVSLSGFTFGGGGISSGTFSTDNVSVQQQPAYISITGGNNQSATVGTAFSTDLSALVTDASSTPIVGVTVTFTAPSSGASGTFSTTSTKTATAVTNGSGVATAPTFTANSTVGGPYNVSASAGSVSTNASMTNILVATHFSVSAPSVVTPGTPFSVTVTALSAGNLIVTNYTGTVHFTNTDGSATLPANSTLTNGIGTFNVTLVTNGTQNIAATDTLNSSIKGSASVVDTTTALTISTVEGEATSSGTVNVSVGAGTVTVSTLNLISGTEIAITSSNPALLLGEAEYAGPSTGVGSLNISTDFKIAGVYTITASEASLPAVASAAVTVLAIPGPTGPTQFFVVSAPSSAYGGSPINFTVTAYDGGGNVATGYSGTVAFSSSDPNAILPGNATLTNGTGTFSATLKTLGNQTITATDTTTGTINGTSGNILVSSSSLVVNTATDDTGTASTCTPNPITTGAGDCTLRDALLEAADLGSANITFDSTVFASAQIITEAYGTLSIPANTSITGPTGGSSVTVSGNSANTVFFVNTGITAALANLTITDGVGSESINGYLDGGGIVNEGALTITGSLITSNTAPYGYGGGVWNSGTLTISGSSIMNNSAPGLVANGGGIWNSLTLTISNSTISGNSASSAGGGIFMAYGSLHVTGSTISGNAANLGAGIMDNGVTVTLVGTTVSSNTASSGTGGVESAGGPVYFSNTIVEGNSGGANQNPDIYIFGGGSFNNLGGNLLNTSTSLVDPGLTTLTNYGGPTLTMIPKPGSPAICAGSSSLIPAGVSTDERGDPLQPTNGYCSPSQVDAGAVQTNYTLSFTAQQPSTVVLDAVMSPAPIVTIAESGLQFNGGPATVSIADADSGLSASATTSVSTSSGQLSFANLEFNHSEADDTLTATIELNPAISSTAPVASAISTSFAVTAASTSTAAFSATTPYSGSSQSVVLTATVTSPAGTVSEGTVTFAIYNGGVQIGSAVTSGTVSSGTASVAYTLPGGTGAGTYTIQATYNSTANFTGSSDSSHTLTVNAARTTTTLAVHDAVTLQPWSGTEEAGAFAWGTGAVSSSGSGATGSVTYTLYPGTDCSGSFIRTSTISLSSGPVTYSDTFGPFAAGTYSMSASYPGDGNYGISSSGCSTFSVSPFASTISVSSGRNPAVFSQSVTLTATITGYYPTGAVGFTSNGTGIAGCTAVTAVAGTAQCVTTLLATGNDAIVATYAGDGNNTSNSGSLSGGQQVNTPNLLWIGSPSGMTSVFLTTGAADLSNTEGGISAAIDSSGNVWSLNAGGDSMSEFSGNGTPTNTTISGGGLASASGLAIDGSDQVWVTNTGGTISIFNSAGNPVLLTPYTVGTSAPASIAIDISGNVWIANNGSNSVTKILGAATPTVPLATGVVYGKPATEP